MADGNPVQGNSLDTIAIRITASSNEASRSIDRLTTSLTNLRGVVSSSLSGLSALAGTIGNLSSSLRTLGSSTDNVRAFRNALNRLGQVDLDNVSRNIREMSSLNLDIAGLREAVRELSGLSRGMSQVNPSLERGATHANRFSLGLGGLKGAIAAIVSSKTIGAIKQMVASTNNYIEAMNLAKVSLGGFFENASAFSENVSSALGIDQGTLLENMGLFQNLSTSFGVSADNAYVLSKNMAQLAYDFASFHNLDIEESFLKFQSALAGELEPIRRVGVDISNARLQQELYDLGLRQNISTLNRADKAVLTYIAIMKQSTNEMGDMARTIQSPANMLRVLGNQAIITGRQIGALFIPALQEILPWAIAVMKVIGQLASTLASLAGFDLNDYLADVDGSAFESMAGDIEDIGTAAGKAAKKMNNLIGGFDELNILKKASASAGTGTIGGNLLDNIDLTKYQYDMLEGLVPTDDLVNQVYDAVDRILEPFQSISFENTVQRFKDFFATIKEQAAAFDWGNLGSGLWESLAGVFVDISNLSSSVVLPFISSLNIPEIVFTGYTALKDGIDAIREGIEAVTPGARILTEKILVPLGNVINEFLVGGFNELSNQFAKLSEWFGGFGERFTALAESASTFGGYIGELLTPLKDSIWPTFSILLDSIRGAFQAVIDNVIAFGRHTLDSINIVLEWADKVGVIDVLKEKFKDVFEGSVKFVAGLIDALSGIITFTTGVFMQDWNTTWDGIRQTFNGIWDAMLGVLQMFFGKTEDELKDWFENKVKPWFTAEKWKQMGRQAVDALFNGLKTAANKIKNFFKDLFDFDQIFARYDAPTNNDYRTPGQVRTLSIPAFASGNVATSPTLALFGEYPGAKSNPEITAPQSTIYETVVAANTEMVGAVYQMASMIVQAIENNATEVSADSEGIFKAVRKGASEYKKTHGVPAF